MNFPRSFCLRPNRTFYFDKSDNAPLTLVLLRGLQQPPKSFRPGAQNRIAKG